MTSALSIPYCGIASDVLSILIVSAERRFVILVGSGRPVSGATHTGFAVVVVTGVVVVVDDVDVVVVVESPDAPETPTMPEPTPMTIKKASKRRIERNYLLAISQLSGGIGSRAGPHFATSEHAGAWGQAASNA
jgi:hypothetical protein